MDKVLVISFKKTNGKVYNFNIAFPVDNATKEAVEALAENMIQNSLITFKDGAELKSLEKAYYKEVKTRDISLA